MITGPSAALIVCGVLFFTAGTAGLIRFPDVRSQLHALTKADNLGLGLIMAGAALYLGSWSTAVLLAIAWVLILGSASVSAHALAAREASEHDVARAGDEPQAAPALGESGPVRTTDRPNAAPAVGESDTTHTVRESGALRRVGEPGALDAPNTADQRRPAP